MLKSCMYCNKEYEFIKKIGRPKLYCSEKCSSRARHGVILKRAEFNDIYICKQCGTDFKSENKKYICSVECEKQYHKNRMMVERKNGKYKPSIRKIYEKHCLICKNKFETKVKQTKYCSIKCIPKPQRKNLDVYRGKEHLRDWNYKNWRLKVYKIDNYTCQCCGHEKGKTLKAHHVESWGNNIDLRYEVTNGITLCETCHINFHKK